MQGTHPAVAVLGPTASGKSALALQIAQRYDSEIVSLDSALIYKDMDIGTAKPDAEELKICPHHLISICDPAQTYSAADFRRDCIRLESEIRSRGRVCVICGGTMMYYKALTDGLSALPETDASIREKVAAMAEEKGWPFVHEALKEIDPVMHAKLSPNDRQRVSRAMEVYLMTGRSMSSFFEAPRERCPFRRIEFVLLPESDDRTKLRKIIRRRFERMLEAGFLDEVRRLKERNLSPDLPSMRSVGYRQALMYLNGECDLEEMVELAVIATARLAKHQMTWLRGGLKERNDDNVERIRLNIEDPENFDLVCRALDDAGFARFRKNPACG